MIFFKTVLARKYHNVLVVPTTVVSYSHADWCIPRSPIIRGFYLKILRVHSFPLQETIVSFLDSA